MHVDEIKRYPILINGEEVYTDDLIAVKNPANYTQTVGYVQKGHREHIDAAVDAAYNAFNSDWSNRKNSRQREKMMRKAIELVRNDIDGLSEIYTKEQGKPLKESKSELESFLSTMDFFAGYGGKLYGTEDSATSGNSELWVIDKPTPIGVIATITPWNFEMSLLGWKIAPALICGNTMVVKPSITTPTTTIRTLRHFYEAGLPKGVINVVTGSSSEIGDYLVSHRKVRKVSFTGSTEVGKRVYQEASKDLKAVTLELGGSDPTIVCDDADLDKAAKDVVLSGRFRNCGQSCTSVKRLYVFENVYDEFLKLVRDYTSKINVGNGLEPDVTMGPLHNSDQRKLVETLVEDAKTYNANIVLGGGKPEGEKYENGYFYNPTILTDVSDDAQIWKKECFGPALPIGKVRDLDEALEKANNTNYGLGSCVWTGSLDRAYEFFNKTESGIVWVNSPPLSVPETAFGGVKESGIGRELGQSAIRENMETKSIRIRF